MNENGKMDPTEEELQKLAREILVLSRNTLLVNLRFMDMALSRLSYLPIEEGTLMTDGKYILFEPRHVLKNYRLAREIPVRDYLHIVMHCVFRHMFVGPTVNRVYWDLACDIAVENALTEFALLSVRAPRESLQKPGLDRLRKQIGMITAEKIYRYLMNSAMSEQEAASLRGAFYADDHEIWYMTDEQKEKRYGAAFAQGTDENGGEAESGSRSETEQDWKKVSERMQVDMETFGKQRGFGAGALVQNLAEVNREKYDYRRFLEKFAVVREVMRVSADEFDNIFYTYGLRLYEKMPLIEPLEYAEAKGIYDFAIAIDTSGSVAGELVQKFMQKTYNILKSTESFFSKINVHIIQCDAKIQEDVCITTQEEFDRYLKTMKLHGFGGTDFRPVFSYVDELCREKKFTKLKGMLYFTDGYGIYPSKKPDYDVAFVFVDDDYNHRDVPPWAIKLLLGSEEIKGD